MKRVVQRTNLEGEPLPVEIVFHPSWWFKHTGITFDQDFYYHPLKRVESEKRMELELFERFGIYGLGEDRNKDLPIIGAVHNAAGYIISEMLGCKVDYFEDAPPQVHVAGHEKLKIDQTDIFKTDVFRKLENLSENLNKKYGTLSGDINWGGILNIALDLQDSKIFMEFFEKPDEIQKYFREISQVIEKFTTYIGARTGSTSISVNRIVKHFRRPLFLHSECSHTMISTEQYEQFLLPFDIEWSRRFRPFGVHYCGPDPHRYARVFQKIPHLDFLDVGWGGDLKELRKFLPDTFLNIRLNPVDLNSYSDEELSTMITRLVMDSDNPQLTGVCCINMDDQVEDQKVEIIFQTVEELRKSLKY